MSGREQQRYSYQYDELDRLTRADYENMTEEQNRGTGSFATCSPPANMFGESMSYDKRGNILSLQRRGLREYQTTGRIGGVYGIIDALGYRYNDKNQVLEISDGGSHTKGFIRGAGSGVAYSYDQNGNMVSDLNKKIVNIQYNYLNLPEVVTFESGNKITWLYDASGRKLRKTTFEAANSKTHTQDYYAGGTEFKDGIFEAQYHSEGRIIVENNALRYEYALKDHLGNTRVMLCDRDTNGIIDPATETVQINHYYPFGMNMEGNWNGANGNNK